MTNIPTFYKEVLKFDIESVNITILNVAFCILDSALVRTAFMRHDIIRNPFKVGRTSSRVFTENSLFMITNLCGCSNDDGVQNMLSYSSIDHLSPV